MDNADIIRYVIKYKDRTFCGEHREADGEFHAIWVYDRWCRNPMQWTTERGAERYLKNRILKIPGDHRNFRISDIRIVILSEGE